MGLSVQAVTFEQQELASSFLACRHIMTISGSNSSIKVIESRSNKENNLF